MYDHHLLPAELWLEIIAWAVHPPTSARGSTIYHLPFQPALVDSCATLNIKRTLSLVCRRWRIWTIRYLYADIRIGRGAHALKGALETTDSHQGYGRMVRRAVLPYTSTESLALISIEILQQCAKLETLVRPCYDHYLDFKQEVECIPLPSLRHLEWGYHAGAERLGGINSLNAVLQNAPNLEHLLIGRVDDHPRFVNVNLPYLRTLHLNFINGIVLHQVVNKWSLPCLSHIIFDSPLIERGLQTLWERFGKQLRRIEFRKHLRFLTGDDHLTTCLQACPNLQELAYYIFFTRSPQTHTEYSSITRVCLHPAVNNILTTAEGVWALLEGHFNFMMRQLPSLQEITLFGDWNAILCQRRFSVIMQKLGQERGTVTLQIWSDTK